jgi:hypothetical protein
VILIVAVIMKTNVKLEVEVVIEVLMIMMLEEDH